MKQTAAWNFSVKNDDICIFQGAKSITTFEILPQPPPSRSQDNPWPTYPRVFKVDYGHEEVKVKFGRDPREYSTLTKVCCNLLYLCNISNKVQWYRNRCEFCTMHERK